MHRESRKSVRAKNQQDDERKRARRKVGCRESNGGRRGSRRGVRGRSDRLRARGTSDRRRRDRGREGGGAAEAGIREAGAGGRNWVMGWGAAHPRAASLSASAFPWAKGSSELVWAGVQEIEIELSRFT